MSQRIKYTYQVISKYLWLHIQIIVINETWKYNESRDIKSEF